MKEAVSTPHPPHHAVFSIRISAVEVVADEDEPIVNDYTPIIVTVSLY